MSYFGDTPLLHSLFSLQLAGLEIHWAKQNMGQFVPIVQDCNASPKATPQGTSKGTRIHFLKKELAWACAAPPRPPTQTGP